MCMSLFLLIRQGLNPRYPPQASAAPGWAGGSRRSVGMSAYKRAKASAPGAIAFIAVEPNAAAVATTAKSPLR